MNDGTGKVIHSFGRRLALDKDLRALGDAHNAFELERRARSLAEQEEGAILNPLIRQLDTENATLRGGLGLLSQYLDPNLIVPALHGVASDSNRPDDARLTAVMILERYLDVPVDPELVRVLPDPKAVARQSAVEALTLAESSPLVLVEFAEQLLDEPQKIVEPVLDVIASMDDPRRARLLATIAAYAPPDIEERVITWLGSIRHQASVESLYTLRHIGHESLRALSERQLRKLQFAGVPIAGDVHSRALWSHGNAQGQSLFWWIRHLPAEQHAALLILVLQDGQGVIHAEARPGIEPADLPAPAPHGTLHPLNVSDGGQDMQLLELAPSLGLGLVEQAVATMRSLDIPWLAELVVFGHWLWSGEGLTEQPTSWPDLPQPVLDIDDDIATDLFVDLFKHDAFAAWVWDVPDIAMLLRSLRKDIPLTPDGELHRLLAKRLVGSDIAPLLAQRLRQQAVWLNLAGEIEVAALALAAGEAVKKGQSDHPFIQTLAWRSLLAAAAEQAVRRTPQIGSRPEG